VCMHCPGLLHRTRACARASGGSTCRDALCSAGRSNRPGAHVPWTACESPCGTHLRVSSGFPGGLTKSWRGWHRYELAVVKPDWLLVAKGLIPDPVIIRDPGMLYVAIGIVGARPRACVDPSTGSRSSPPAALRAPAPSASAYFRGGAWCQPPMHARTWHQRRTSGQPCAPTRCRRAEAACRFACAESAQSCTCLWWSGPWAGRGRAREHGWAAQARR